MQAPTRAAGWRCRTRPIPAPLRAGALSLHVVSHDPTHQVTAHKLPPAMTGGDADRLGTVEVIAERIDARSRKQGERGPYKKRLGE
ncbi:hypothetical protein C3941_21700 [Kaistia algarum]|nr:hypothetical protein C3941_21700 [Kaistia algarum]